MSGDLSRVSDQMQLAGEEQSKAVSHELAIKWIKKSIKEKTYMIYKITVLHI